MFTFCSPATLNIACNFFTDACELYCVIGQQQNLQQIFDPQSLYFYSLYRVLYSWKMRRVHFTNEMLYIKKTVSSNCYKIQR